MLGIIGGSGFEDALHGECEIGSRQTVETEYGDATLTLFQIDGVDKIAFLARHGDGHSIPPHNIRHHANIAAFKKVGIRNVVSTSAVGALRSVYNPGDLVVVSDFLDMRGGSPTTLFDRDRVVHTDFSDPFSHKLRILLSSQLNDAVLSGASSRLGTGACVYPEGVYVCVNGPRYETPAEVRAFAMLGGDVVGMTVAAEAILAREMGLEYASVSVVANLATGLSSTPLSHDEVVEIMTETRPLVVAAFLNLAASAS